MVFGAQSGDAAPAPTRTSPPARTPSSKQAPTKPSETQDSRSRLNVKSKIALVVDANTSEELLVKNADRVVPIASITKLMTAMVVLDAKLPLGEMLKISDDDRDLVMGTISRLRVGWALSREDMLHLALMSSENRAAAALSRYYPGGRPAFIKAMNAKAAELGMTKTHFVNPNGLTNENVSTAFDLAKLVRAADQYPLIRRIHHGSPVRRTDRPVCSSLYQLEPPGGPARLGHRSAKDRIYQRSGPLPGDAGECGGPLADHGLPGCLRKAHALCRRSPRPHAVGAGAEEVD